MDDPPRTPPIPSRSLGWVPDDPHVRRQLHPIGHLLGGRGDLPAEVSFLEPLLDGINDQGGSMACVGYTWAEIIALRLAHARKIRARFSAYAIWAYARMLGRGSASEALQNQGCQPMLALQGMRQFGIPNESDWPADEARACDEPPFDVLEKSSAFELSGVYDIGSSGEARVADIRQSLAAGYPVAFGTQVDDVFVRMTGDRPVAAPQGRLRGGHMMSFIGYRTGADGGVLFRGLNHWGGSWGDRGLFWATEEYVKAEVLGDLTALTITSRGNA